MSTSRAAALSIRVEHPGGASLLSILASRRSEARQGDQASGGQRGGVEGLGSAAASGDSPEAHGHRRGMGRPAEERHWSVQRGARSQGQSLPGPPCTAQFLRPPSRWPPSPGPQGLPACGVRRLRPRWGGGSGQGQARLELTKTEERSRLGVTVLGVCCPVQETGRAGRGVLTVEDLP